MHSNCYVGSCEASVKGMTILGSLQDFLDASLDRARRSLGCISGSQKGSKHASEGFQRATIYSPYSTPLNPTLTPTLEL